ncbi:hypothetical protein [Desulfocastanea catecholica]
MNYFERLLTRALAQTGGNTQSLFDPFEQTVADLEWPISKAVPTNENSDTANAILPLTSLVVHETTWLNGKASTEQTDISDSQAQAMAEPMTSDLRVVPPSVMPKPPGDDNPAVNHDRDLGSVTETNHHALQHADEFMRALGVNASIGTSVSPRTEKIEPTKAQTASAMAPSQLVRPPVVPVTPKTSKERPPSSGSRSADTVSESSAQKNNEPRESLAETTIPTRLTTPQIETHVVVRTSSISWVEEIQQSRSRAFGMGQL